MVAAFDVPPERPELRLRIARDGELVSVSALRWRREKEGYVACGCEVRAERRFGDLTVPSDVRVGWWFGTPRYRPFFEAEVAVALDAAANAAATSDADIGAPGAAVRTIVLTAREDLEVARQVRAALA